MLGRPMNATVHPLVSLDVYFVLTPSFLMLDRSGPAEAFAYAARFGASFRVNHIAAAETIESATGLSLSGLRPLPETLPEGALVIVPGVMAPLESYRCREAAAVAEWLRRTLTEHHRL